MRGYAKLSDERLISKARKGDREAFAALYERHFHGVYDFAFRVVRDAEVAGDVVQSAFVKTWEHLGKGKVPRNVRAWIYTLARNAAVDELRYRKRVITAEKGVDGERRVQTLTELDPERFSDPQAAYEDKELVNLVWRSAAALRQEEYALLDLYLRQGLTTNELAQGLGVSKGTLYTRLSRLRDSLEESVVADFLVRRGRRDCPRLDRLLSGLRAGELTRDVREAVHDHLKECDRCQQSKRRYASPVEILAGLAAVPAPSEMPLSIWERIGGDIRPGTSGQGVLKGWRRFVTKPQALYLGTGAVVLTLGGITTWLLLIGLSDVTNRTEALGISRDLASPDGLVGASAVGSLRTNPTVALDDVPLDGTPGPTPTESPLPTRSTSIAPGGSATVPSDTPSPAPSTTPPPTSTPTTTPSPTRTRPPTATPIITPAPSSTPSPMPVVWENDPFDGLAPGALSGQNGWVDVRASPQVVDDQGEGMVLRVDPTSGATVVVTKDVPDQRSGLHRFEFDVMVEGASEASLAKIEVQTTPNGGWDKKFQIYFGASVRANYDPSGAAASLISTVQMGRWYHIRCEIDLGAGSFDVWVDGALVASGVPMHPGPITSLALSGWDLSGSVSLDDLMGSG